ncbi:hypothetical protein LIER_17251 [Lithospermum erythrorhizon]|uniref:Reverse transcriptase n=1 Tax=Lithospermum erythrorhizon TaxID=34254 RepID=A0AAV3QDZ6_LITER
MNTLGWNCRGLGPPRVVRAFHHLIKSNKSYSSHRIEAIVVEEDQNPWKFMGFYGHHEVQFRRHSWELLKFIKNKSDLPTVYLGDFNEFEDGWCLYEDSKEVVEKAWNLMDWGALTFGQLNTLSSTQAAMVGMHFNSDYVKKALFSMRKGKAPGLDGMPTSFYQFYWDIVEEDISNMVLNCVNEGRFLRKFNFIVIALIPKVPNPIEITQFRPISLCNTIAKLIAKVLAERLKRVLDSIVSASQSAFVPNRLITDNILLAYEVHHFIKLRKTGRK